MAACAEVRAQQLCLHCRWLQFNMSANYDILAIASTDNAARVETTCRHCIFVYAHDLGAAVGRYAPLTGLIESSKWRELVPGKYDYIYFPEEEVVQTVESVNRCVAVSRTSRGKATCAGTVSYVFTVCIAVSAYSV